MPFLRREDIPEEIRAPYDKQHKAALRKALLSPGLTAAQRQHLQEQIRSIGKPKNYSADSPPKPGAVTFPKPGESS